MAGKPKHGLSRTPEYRAWQQMRRRCTNPEHPAWPGYGGRGITVCARWLDDVEAFVADVGRRPGPGFELDRIDNDRGYEPGNCRWVDRQTNSRNRRSNRILTHAGRSRTLSEWASMTGIAADTIAKRIAAGWSVGRALETPPRSKTAKGNAKDPRTPCVDCRAPTTGDRCRSCDNRHRWASGVYS